MSEKINSAVIENAKSELVELLDAVRTGRTDHTVGYQARKAASNHGFSTVGDYLHHLLDIILNGETITLR